MLTIPEMQAKARQFRRELFEKWVAMQAGHPGSVLSVLDIMIALYYGGSIRKCYDRVVLSKGHAAPALYPILDDLRVLPKGEWEKWGHDQSSILRTMGSVSIPGIDATTGSLGHGLGIAAGYALSYKRRKTGQCVYVILSEGDLLEGSTWEALGFISHYRLDHMYLVIDRNWLITLGSPGMCLEVDPLDKKLQAFGFNVYECDGHDFDALDSTLAKMLGHRAPACLIANTIKGKGISFMEGCAKWHYWNELTRDELAKARDELK